MRRLIVIFALTFVSACAFAQVDSLVNLKLAENHITVDTSYVKKVKLMNDYSLLGLTYGVRLSSVSFDPSRSNDMQFVPFDVGITYTHYCKMFGYMPYFGVQLGLYYSQDQYKFTDPEQGYYSDSILGAASARIQTLELPAMAHFHYDFWKMKIMVNLGVYGGYRLAVQRSRYISEEAYEKYKEYEYSFHPNERRWDYGLKVGAGFGFMFDPIELHFNVAYKYSWSNLHQPNVNARTMEHDEQSKYYYKWSYPTNIVFSISVLYQLSRRVGAKRSDIRAQAKEEARLMYEQMLQAEAAKAVSDSLAAAKAPLQQMDTTVAPMPQPDAAIAPATQLDTKVVPTDSLGKSFKKLPLDKGVMIKNVK